MKMELSAANVIESCRGLVVRNSHNIMPTKILDFIGGASCTPP